MKSDSKSTDAFGQQLWDYYHGKETAEIVVERDDGYIDPGIGTINRYFSDFNDWLPAEKAAIRFAHGRILDVGCGAGRQCLYLQKKGFDVLGIDKSPLAIKICKLRGVKQAKILPFEQIGKLKPLKFDSILMFGNNFGLFGNYKKARRLLKILYQRTTPRAIIIAITFDPHKTNLPEHHEYHKRNLTKNRMVGQIRLRYHYGKIIGPWFDYLFVSKAELRQLIAKTNWKIKKFIDRKGSPTYAVVLEKS